MKTLLHFVLFASSIVCFGQPKNLAERLGYPKDAKLLIVHADDIVLTP